MTDSGWDIPGVPHEEPPAAGGSSLEPDPGFTASADECGRRAAWGSKGRPAASVSALGGSSAGAFARPGVRRAPSQDGALSPTSALSWHAAASSASAAASSTPVPSSPDGAPAAASSPAGSFPAAPPAGSAPACPPVAAARPADAAQALAFVSAGLEFLVGCLLLSGLWIL
jgi:hypothetical protein